MPWRCDSTFLLAAWRLGNARRWMPLRPTPPFPDNFRDLFARHGRDLPRTDSLLIAAQFAPSGGARFAAYESALASDTANATAMLLYGDELFHRGPLAGRPLEEAARMLARATAANPRLAPAWEHLTWAPHSPRSEGRSVPGARLARARGGPAPRSPRSSCRSS